MAMKSSDHGQVLMGSVNGHAKQGSVVIILSKSKQIQVRVEVKVSVLGRSGIEFK